MATKYGDNYTKQYITRPSEKIEKGEIAGRKRLVFEVETLDYAAAVNDVILGPYLPANSLVTAAKIKIDKSLGATGIFDLGHGASDSDVADSDAFVTGADGGGQAALASEAAANVGIFKRFAEKVQLQLICTEVMDGAVLDGKIYFEVEYVND